MASDYPACRSLFCNRLALRNATIDHVVDELLSLRRSNHTGKLKELLFFLNDYLLRGALHSAVHKLKGTIVIPVVSEYEALEDADYLWLAYDKHVFYLADRSSLLERFRGKVPIADFTVNEVRRLSPLIDAMDLKDWLLSEAATETTQACGDLVYDEERTIELGQRTKYIFQ